MKTKKLLKEIAEMKAKIAELVATSASFERRSKSLVETVNYLIEKANGMERRADALERQEPPANPAYPGGYNCKCGVDFAQKPDITGGLEYFKVEDAAPQSDRITITRHDYRIDGKPEHPRYTIQINDETPLTVSLEFLYNLQYALAKETEPEVKQNIVKFVELIPGDESKGDRVVVRIGQAEYAADARDWLQAARDIINAIYGWREVAQGAKE